MLTLFEEKMECWLSHTLVIVNRGFYSFCWTVSGWFVSDVPRLWKGTPLQKNRVPEDLKIPNYKHKTRWEFRTNEVFWGKIGTIWSFEKNLVKFWPIVWFRTNSVTKMKVFLILNKLKKIQKISKNFCVSIEKVFMTSNFKFREVSTIC